MPYSKALLATHFKHGSVYMSIPNFLTKRDAISDPHTATWARVVLPEIQGRGRVVDVGVLLSLCEIPPPGKKHYSCHSLSQFS